MFSVCEMPPSPWQPTQSSAFSLPAAESAAWAGTPASADNPSARQYSVSNTNRRRIIGIPDHPACHSGARVSANPESRADNLQIPDRRDSRALIFVPIPGPMLGDQDVVLVLGGELVAGIEFHAERSHVGAEIDHRRGEFRTLVTHREFRIGHVTLVAIRIAKMLADLRDHVELVARQIVADPVARVLGEPVFSG